jgi:hypothetical protein
VFLYVIQLGAILAVVVLFWHKLIPFSTRKTAAEKRSTYNLWGKIIIACIPGAVFGILFNDKVDALIAGTPTAKAVTIAAALIFYGIIFIVIENADRNKPQRIATLQKLDYKNALLIGLFQVLSLIPGTSRSGITIIGAMLIGASRPMAPEFTFFFPSLPCWARALSSSINSVWISPASKPPSSCRHGRRLHRLHALHPLFDELRQKARFQGLRLVQDRAGRDRTWVFSTIRVKQLLINRQTSAPFGRLFPFFGVMIDGCIFVK